MLDSNEWAEAMSDLGDMLEELKDNGVTKTEVLQQVNNTFGDGE